MYGTTTTTKNTEIYQADSVDDCTHPGFHQIRLHSPGRHHTPNRNRYTGCSRTETCLHGTGRLLENSMSTCFIPDIGMKNYEKDKMM